MMIWPLFHLQSFLRWYKSAPSLRDRGDSDEAGSESPDLLSQQNKAAFWEEARIRSPDLFGQQMNEDALNLVGEHIQVESEECDDNGDKEDQVAMDDKDFSWTPFIVNPRRLKGNKLLCLKERNARACHCMTRLLTTLMFPNLKD